jgi:hypothetical protein
VAEPVPAAGPVRAEARPGAVEALSEPRARVEAAALEARFPQAAVRSVPAPTEVLSPAVTPAGAEGAPVAARPRLEAAVPEARSPVAAEAARLAVPALVEVPVREEPAIPAAPSLQAEGVRRAAPIAAQEHPQPAAATPVVSRALSPRPAAAEAHSPDRNRGRVAGQRYHRVAAAPAASRQTVPPASPLRQPLERLRLASPLRQPPERLPPAGTDLPGWPSEPRRVLPLQPHRRLALLSWPRLRPARSA